MSIHEGMHKIAARFGVGPKFTLHRRLRLDPLHRAGTSLMAIERKYERDIEPPLAPYP
jgi:hypothetical protein